MGILSTLPPLAITPKTSGIKIESPQHLNSVPDSKSPKENEEKSPSSPQLPGKDSAKGSTPKKSIHLNIQSSDRHDLFRFHLVALFLFFFVLPSCNNRSSMQFLQPLLPCLTQFVPMVKLRFPMSPFLPLPQQKIFATFTLVHTMTLTLL